MENYRYRRMPQTLKIQCDTGSDYYLRYADICETGFMYHSGGGNLAFTEELGALTNISDIIISSPVDNEILAYDNGTSNWINQTPNEANIVSTVGTQSIAGAKTFTDILKTTKRIVVNDVSHSTAYELSVQSNATSTWLEILNNGGTNKGVFFGIQNNDFELWNYQGGDTKFYVSPTPSAGIAKFIMKNNGVLQIVDLNAGVVKSDASGNLTYEVIGTAFNKNFGTTSGTILDGSHSTQTTTHGVSGAIVGTTDSQALTNKTLTDSSNALRATELATTTTSVSISSASAPTIGQVLKATSATTATWQDTTTGITGATTGAQGIIRIATQTETNTATSNEIAITPSTLSNYSGTIGGVDLKALELYDAVVDASGNGDYTTVGAAFTAGAISVFVRSGSYTENANIDIPNGGSLFGESMDQVILNMGTGCSVKIDGSSGTKMTAGTITATHSLSGSSTIVGVGTTFTNISLPAFISLGNNFYPVASITDATNLTIGPPYKGVTITGGTYILQQMHSTITVQNLTIVGSTVAGFYVRATRHSSFINIICRNNAIATEVIECGNTNFTSIMSQNTAGVGFKLTNTQSCVLQACQAFNSTSHGIHIMGDSSDIVVSGCQVANSGGTGIVLDGTSSSTNIIGCLLEGNSGKGVDVIATAGTNLVKGCTIIGNGSDAIDFDGDNNVVDSCILKNNGGHGVQAGNDGSISNNQISNNGGNGVNMDGDSRCQVIGNNIVNNAVGILMSVGAQDNVISGNTICANTTHGINTNGSDDLVIAGNNIFENTAGTGILVGNTSLRVNISGNTLTNNNAGINVQVNSNDAIISGNIIRGCTTFGISCASNTCVIANNRSTVNTGNGCTIVAGATDITVFGNNFQGNTGVDFSDSGTITNLAGILSNDLDTRSATTLLLGKAIATKVEIADTGITTEIQGHLDVIESVDVTGNITVTGLVDGRDIATDGTTQDSHIADATLHFTEASIRHTLIAEIGTNTHAQIDTHIADATLHFTEASIDHTAITNIGTNTHTQIDSHIANTSNPHTVTQAQLGIAGTTQSAQGLIELATQAEVDAGTDNVRAVTPLTLQNKPSAGGAPPACTIVSASTLTSTSSTSYILIPSMTQSPASGTYFVMLTGSAKNGLVGTVSHFSIYYDDAIVSNSIMQIGDNKYTAFICIAKITAVSGKKIDGYFKTDGNCDVTFRKLSIIKVT